MKKVCHLALGTYILYCFILTTVLSFIPIVILPLLFKNLFSDETLWIILLVLIFISMIYFYFYVIIIEEDSITFSQMYKLKRRKVKYNDFSKLMYKYYYFWPKYHKTNYGQRGYKFNISSPKDYVKILSYQYALKTKNAMFDAIVSKNPDVYINKLLQKEIKLIKSKLITHDLYVKDSFDELIELGFSKDYFTRNGEEEIVFKREGVIIEIFHFASTKSMEIDIVMTHNGNRFNLNEKFLGKKQWFTSVEDALDTIRKYLIRV